MPNICQSLATPYGRPLCEDAGNFEARQIAACLETIQDIQTDRTGQQGYTFLNILTDDQRQDVLQHLTDPDYAARISDFDKLVRIQADEFRDKYLRWEYQSPRQHNSTHFKGKRDYNVAWQVRHFVQQELPKRFPEFKNLPIRYAPISPTDYAVYTAGNDTIWVGALFMRDVRHHLWGEVKCTMGHEWEHRLSNHNSREITEPLYHEALKLADQMLVQKDPAKPFSDFRRAMWDQLWYDDDNDYENSEGEALARLYEVGCYQTMRYHVRATSLAIANRTANYHIQTLNHKYSPVVAAGIIRHMEHIVNEDIPQSREAFATRLYSGGENWANVLFQSYNAGAKACTTAALQQCTPPTPEPTAMAKPAMEQP